MKRKIEHIITGLTVGGAEFILSRLVKGSIRYEHSVTSLTGTSHIADDLLADNVAVTQIGMKKNVMALRQTGALVTRLRTNRPHLVQTWLYHADLIGGIAARRAGLPVVWNLRQTSVARGAHKFNTAVIVRLCALLSRSIPVKIVCGSNAARETHRRMGFAYDRMIVITNGVDTHVFRRDSESRAEMRRELGLAADTLVVGRIGRYHVQKDYYGLIETAKRLVEKRGDVCFVLAGLKVDWDNRELTGWIRNAGLGDRFHLLGLRKDVAKIMTSLDVFISPSIFGEGFPNVIAEAMACEVPCIATDVGDSAAIVGRTDRIVPPADYEGLANAVGAVLAQDVEQRRRDGEEARLRVTKRFALESMIDNYESLYEQIIGIDQKPIYSGSCT